MYVLMDVNPRVYNLEKQGMINIHNNTSHSCVYCFRVPSSVCIPERPITQNLAQLVLFHF